MNIPDSPENSPRIFGNLLPLLESKKRGVLHAVHFFLQNVTIDSTDRDIITKAMAFIENPTGNLADMKNQTADIEQVICGFMMEGKNIPKAIENMAAYLWTLQCIHGIQFIEAAIQDGSIQSAAILIALNHVHDWATTLAKGYKDHTILNAVNELRTKLPQQPQ